MNERKLIERIPDILGGAIVDRYMGCIEEIINLTVLQERFR
jgi:hypothetical protein